METLFDTRKMHDDVCNVVERMQRVESETNSDLIEQQQDTLLNPKQKQTKFGNIKLRRWWLLMMFRRQSRWSVYKRKLVTF